ncbi:MAG: bifunctional UDP-sugar hydrolase/5'-nucleotidase [bacterium]
MRRCALALASAVALSLALAGAGRAEVVHLTVVHTNDVHGGIDPTGATYMNREFPPRLGGGASMITLVERVREDVARKGGRLLLVDAGDIFQGTPVGTLSKGRVVMDFMNAVRYDVMSLGNHDFDEGQDNTRSLVRRATFPVLAANLIDVKTGKTADWVEPWIVKDFGNLKVGIFGLITAETKNMSFPANVAGLEFAPLVPTARRCVQELRAQGVDLVLGLGHVGIPYDPKDAVRQRERDGWPAEDDDRATAIDVAHEVPGIDAFFAGHIHKGFDDAWVDPVTHTYVFQTYGRGSGAGIVTLDVDTATNQIVGTRFWSDRGYLVTFFEDEFWPEAKTAQTIGAEVAQAESGMDREIGRATGKFSREGEGETPMGNAVCDAMLEETGADFAFSNLGGIRDDFGPGSISPRDVFKVLPFDNKLVVVQMSGTLLRDVIETRVSGTHGGLYIAGGRVKYNATRPDFDRVVSFSVGGGTWDPGRTYRVVTSDFLMQGNNELKMLPGIPAEKQTYTGKTMREAFENWIARHTPVSPQVDGRWVRDDSAAPDPDFAAAARRGSTP